MSIAKKIHQAAVKTLPLNKLVNNSVQPSNRTNEKSLVPLIESLRAHGLIDLPYVALLDDGRYMKINGHRRCAAWAAMGNTTIPCHVIEGISQSEAECLFAEIDIVTNAIKAKGSFEGWANSVDREAYLETFKGRAIVNHISGMVKVFGEEATLDLARKAVLSPAIVGCIYSLHKFLSLFSDKVPTRRVVGWWIINHRMSTTSLVAVATGKQTYATKIRKAIESDKPFKFE